MLMATPHSGQRAQCPWNPEVTQIRLGTHSGCISLSQHGVLQSLDAIHQSKYTGPGSIAVRQTQHESAVNGVLQNGHMAQFFWQLGCIKVLQQGIWKGCGNNGGGGRRLEWQILHVPVFPTLTLIFLAILYALRIVIRTLWIPFELLILLGKVPRWVVATCRTSSAPT